MKFRLTNLKWTEPGEHPQDIVLEIDREDILDAFDGDGISPGLREIVEDEAILQVDGLEPGFDIRPIIFED